MQRPRHIQGYCPHYDEQFDICYLSEQRHDQGTTEYNCKSDQNCKTCGNYEAWVSGSNYTDK